nr:MAG TPA: hypothetical protein [Caudoviricetes sp.]
MYTFFSYYYYIYYRIRRMIERLMIISLTKERCSAARGLRTFFNCV